MRVLPNGVKEFFYRYRHDGRDTMLALGRYDPQRDVRLELARVYRQMDRQEIKSQDGTRMAYVLRQIHDVIVSAELERRIGELEERQTLPGRPALEARAH